MTLLDVNRPTRRNTSWNSLLSKETDNGLQKKDEQKSVSKKLHQICFPHKKAQHSGSSDARRVQTLSALLQAPNGLSWRRRETDLHGPWTGVRFTHSAMRKMYRVQTRLRPGLGDPLHPRSPAPRNAQRIYNAHVRPGSPTGGSVTPIRTLSDFHPASQTIKSRQNYPVLPLRRIWRTKLSSALSRFNFQLLLPRQKTPSSGQKKPDAALQQSRAFRSMEERARVNRRGHVSERRIRSSLRHQKNNRRQSKGPLLDSAR